MTEAGTTIAREEVKYIPVKMVSIQQIEHMLMSARRVIIQFFNPGFITANMTAYPFNYLSHISVLLFSLTTLHIR